MKVDLFGTRRTAAPPSRQLLKWIGSKQRFAREIVSYFPPDFKVYYEPFLGSGAVLGALAPEKGVASDSFEPLMEIWQKLHDEPGTLKRWYAERRERLNAENKRTLFESVKAAYNARPNGADLVFLCRACYGGVVRFRKVDGCISTPCGIHTPISSESFAQRVDEWHQRTMRVSFRLCDYRAAMVLAKEGDLVYCDPPYRHTQSILYGSQDFSLKQLLETISECKQRGVFVALSIDGKKRSGERVCELPIPDGLFEREIFVHCGRSMLKRFQMEGSTLENDVVADRLLLTY